MSKTSITHGTNEKWYQNFDGYILKERDLGEMECKFVCRIQGAQDRVQWRDNIRKRLFWPIEWPSVSQNSQGVAVVEGMRCYTPYTAVFRYLAYTVCFTQKTGMFIPL
jgi:hypothetical protein